MIDLHSHILPGVDDGARDLEDAIGIARAAAEDGIRTIAATPHVREHFPTTADEMERGVVELRRALAGEGVDVELLTGGELAHDSLPQLSADELRRFGLGGSSRYLLVETPYYDWPADFADEVFRLQDMGFTPVIAHPERNRAIQADTEKLAVLVANGALVQVTAASLDGRLGSSTRACTEQLLRRELAHLLASDAHSPGLRAVGLSGARAAVGSELGRWLTEDVPAAIVAGDELPPRPAKGKRGLFSRFRGRL